MERRTREASRLAQFLRKRGRPLPWPGAEPPDGRFFLEAGELGLWEWRRPFPPGGRPWVALDLETTGLSPARDAITEIAVVRLEGGEPRAFATLVRPHRPIPPRVERLTGITNELVRDAPPLEEALEAALPMLKDAVWVIQNAGFDLGFLAPALARLGVRMEPDVVDTLVLARRGLPGLRSYRLARLAEVLGWEGEGRHHRARADAEAALWVARELYYLLGRGRPLALEALCRKPSIP